LEVAYARLPVPRGTVWSTVEKTPSSWRVECRLGDVQPGAVVFGAPFYLASEASYDDIPVRARAYGDNIRAMDVELTLHTRAQIAYWSSRPGGSDAPVFDFDE
jgi:hypothetical protein